MLDSVPDSSCISRSQLPSTDSLGERMGRSEVLLLAICKLLLGGHHLSEERLADMPRDKTAAFRCELLEHLEPFPLQLILARRLNHPPEGVREVTAATARVPPWRLDLLVSTSIRADSRRGSYK